MSYIAHSVKPFGMKAKNPSIFKRLPRESEEALYELSLDAEEFRASKTVERHLIRGFKCRK